MAFTSLLISCFPCSEEEAAATVPAVCTCSTNNSPWACLLSNACSGATQSSIANLSLSDCCFNAGKRSLALFNHPVNSS
uniref:Uncharacterized protein n=1 Tax=Panstrongylus lignarius TaxID=156445 RepID=A0A224XSZ0_9HEMI